MMSKLVALRMFVALAMGLALAFAAEAAGSFLYHGVLRDADGSVPSNRNPVLQFRIYDVATGGSALWGRTYTVQLDDSGLFSVELNDTTGNWLVNSSLQAVLSANASKTLYLGVMVWSSSMGEIAPRQVLLPVPYAAHAADAAAAANGFAVTGNETVNGSEAVSGDLRVAGTAQLKALEAPGVTVGGEVKAGTSGRFSGFGTVPLGTIIMWSGSTVPDGWALCNGGTSNGYRTPDLRDRFVVGAGSGYSVGNTGGAAAVTLSVSELPSHNHTMTMWGGDIDDDWKRQNNIYLTHDKYGNGFYNTRETNYTGGNQAHENRPPYYALCYIMRVK